ncbi:unnamed protein product [Gordionus sp. m RMFG-2023]
MFDSGIHVEINSTEGILIFKTLIPKKYKNRTLGLLGKWNNDISDDLTSRNGILIKVNSPPEVIYRDFGLSWAITNSSDSVLLYHEGSSHESFNDELKTFYPTFDWMQEIGAKEQENILQICGTSVECAYDLALTKNEKIAKSSKTTIDDFIVSSGNSINFYSSEYL